MPTTCVPVVSGANIIYIHSKSLLEAHVCIRLDKLCERMCGCAGNLRITGNVNFPGRVSYVAGTCSLNGEGNNNNSSDDDDMDDDYDQAS